MSEFAGRKGIMNDEKLGWLGIARLGIVQMALGSVVVLTTSTLNRVMVVELALPALLPGALVGLHYALQVFRPRLGHGSDVGGRRTPWIVGGMATLSGGGLLAAIATAWMASNVMAGVALAVAAFVMIGIGVGAAGTSLLVLLAQRTDETRRGAAATIVWVMMIMGFITDRDGQRQAAGPLLSHAPGGEVAAIVAIAAFLLSLAAVWGMEPGSSAAVTVPPAAEKSGSFREALREVWQEPETRRFAIFVFVSMLAYSAQDLILEPFAGLVFGLTPGQTTQLSGVQNGGVLTGMLVVAVFAAASPACRGWVRCAPGRSAAASPRRWRWSDWPWPVRAARRGRCGLGVCPRSRQRCYAIAAIGSMMALVGPAGRDARAPHGPVGRGAGNRLWRRWPARHGSERSRPARAGQRRGSLWHGVLHRGLVVRRRCLPGGACRRCTGRR
jgi:BCD family chlorophyll transporter-like MFS transporter